jgi:hypothetical protein
MAAIIAGLIPVAAMLLFVGILMFEIDATPLWIVIIFCAGLMVVDFVTSMRRGDNY